MSLLTECAAALPSFILKKFKESKNGEGQFAVYDSFFGFSLFTPWPVTVLHVVAKGYVLATCVAYCLCHYILLHFIFTVSSAFCSLDKFGVRTKQLEHEGTTHPVPVTERKELKVNQE